MRRAPAGSSRRGGGSRRGARPSPGEPATRVTSTPPASEDGVDDERLIAAQVGDARQTVIRCLVGAVVISQLAAPPS